MTAKEYLRNFRKTIINIRYKSDTKRERLKRIESILTSPAVGELKRDKVQTSIDLRKQENMIVEKQLLEDDICKLAQEEAAILLRVGKQIDGMETDLYARLLHLYYEENLTLAEIADIIHYSEDHTRHMHGYALSEFTRLYGNDII